MVESLEAKKTSPEAIKLRSARSAQQYKEVTAYLLFILTTGLSIGYYVTFKTYHTSLNKMESLKKLLANPNARVAAGQTGKSILKRIKADNKKKSATKKLT